MDAKYGNIIVDTQGRIHVIAVTTGDEGEYRAGHRDVYYAVSTDFGATFGQPEYVNELSDSVPFFWSNPSVAVDEKRGYVYAVYIRDGKGIARDLVVAVSNDLGKVWQRRVIHSECATHLVPNIIVDSTTGNVHITWYDNRGAAGRFVHGMCTAGLLQCQEHGAINRLPFASLSYGRQMSSWLGDYTGLVIDLRSRLLHFVWTQPLQNGEGPDVSRILYATEKL